MNADAKHKLIRRYEVTDAAVHDNQKLDGLLTKGDTSAEVFADSAYRSSRIEAQLRASGSRTRPVRTIRPSAHTNHPVTSKPRNHKPFSPSREFFSSLLEHKIKCRQIEICAGQCDHKVGRCIAVHVCPNDGVSTVLKPCDTIGDNICVLTAEGKCLVSAC